MRPAPFALIAIFLSCKQPPAPTVAGASEPAALVAARLDSVIVSWVGDERSLKAWSPRGEPLWTLGLPDGDEPVAPLAVALDSGLYVRGERALYAVSPKGELRWSRRLAAEVVPTEAAKAPAAMSNSGVVFAADPRTLVALTPDGVEMWKYVIAPGEVLKSSPVSMPNGLITVVTSGAVMQLASDGVPLWRGQTSRK